LANEAVHVIASQASMPTCWVSVAVANGALCCPLTPENQKIMSRLAICLRLAFEGWPEWHIGPPYHKIQSGIHAEKNNNTQQCALTEFFLQANIVSAIVLGAIFQG
jgi:hypothetical protein